MGRQFTAYMPVVELLGKTQQELNDIATAKARNYYRFNGEAYAGLVAVAGQISLSPVSIVPGTDTKTPQVASLSITVEL